ncbi:MAG: DUF6152 family protein [Hylemonella sp.]
MVRRRRYLVLCGGALLWLALAQAHHGWSGFDLERPLYLQGRVVAVRWQNPHAEVVLELAAPLALPADLGRRAVPAQLAAIDGQALLARAQLPRRRDARWEIELAPLSRMQAWGIEPLRSGMAIAVVGYTARDEQGAAVLRVEYLFIGERIYGLRSSPA